MEESKSIEERFTDLAPRASRIVFSNYIGWTEMKFDQDIAEGIIAAIKKLPSSGSIRKKNDKNIVKAISWLFDEIPNSDKRREEIEEWLVVALKRI